MNSLKIAAAISLAFLAACSTTEQKPSPISNNLKVENPAITGIVQVFNMVGNTVVQVRDIDQKRPTFYNSDNVEISHEIIGQTAVLKGTHPSFTMVVGTHRTKVTKTADNRLVLQPLDPAVNLVAQSAVPAITAASSDDQILSEIKRLKDELASLKKQYAVPSSVAVVPPSQPKVGAGAADSGSTGSGHNTVRVHFDDNSSEFRPRDGVGARLIELAKVAGEINITGYTDSAKSNPGSAKLAKARAEAAGRYLIANGVDKRKISTAAKAGGGFIASNDNAGGRSQNRRVEIEII